MNHTAILRLLGLLLVVWQVTGCADSAPKVSLKGQQFEVELAISRQEQTRGLMFREHLPAGSGMLFIFPNEAPRSFWMKNTRIPLDILFFDQDLRLVNVARNARPCVADPCPGYPSTGPARYVLELNAGMADTLDVQPGDPLSLLFEP